MSHLFHEYGPDRGEIAARKNGSLVSMEDGDSHRLRANMVQERGRLMVEPGDEIYVGMIVGENARENDIPVNPCKAKHLTNMRSPGRRQRHSARAAAQDVLERALEYIGADEYVEATPKSCACARNPRRQRPQARRQSRRRLTTRLASDRRPHRARLRLGEA